MRLKAAVILLFALPLPASADDFSNGIIKDAAAAYGKQKYNDSIRLLEPLGRLNPKNPLLHYYLANNYFAKGNWDGAKQEYRVCLNLQPSSDVRHHCIKALGQLQHYFPGTHSNSQQQLMPPVANDFVMINAPALSRQAQERRNKYESHYRHRIEQNEQHAQKKIDAVERNNKHTIEGLPRYEYIGDRKVSSSNYAHEVAFARQQANRQIKDIREFLARDNAHAKAELDRHTSDVERMTSNFLAEVNSDRGPIGIMPGGSGLHVKNYVNFGDDSDPLPPVIVPLRAKQERFKPK